MVLDGLDNLVVPSYKKIDLIELTKNIIFFDLILEQALIRFYFL